MSITEADIVVGGTYRAKRYREYIFGCNNDRCVLWISEDRTKVQYDSSTVKIGQRRPIIPMEKFVKWTKERIA